MSGTCIYSECKQWGKLWLNEYFEERQQESEECVCVCIHSLLCIYIQLNIPLASRFLHSHMPCMQE